MTWCRMLDTLGYDKNEGIPSKSLVGFTKPYDNTLQDKVQTQLTSAANIDTGDTLRQV